MRYFFSFMNDVPTQYATPAFSIQHLGILSLFICVYAILTNIFKKKSQKVRSRYVLILAFLLLFFDILNEVWLVLIGHFNVKAELPLQLCGIMCIIIPLMVLTKERFLIEFVYACGMPGAFLAMLTPNIQGYYFISWGFLIFIVIHSLIVYVPLFMLITGEFRPQLCNFSKGASLFFVLVIMDLIVDRRLDSNYLYLKWAPKGTLLDIFASWVGSPGYIFIEIFVAVIVWMALYLPWELFYRDGQCENLKTEQEGNLHD